MPQQSNTSLLSFMSSPLRFALTDSDSPHPVRNTPRQDGGGGDDQIASIHDLFQWATPRQNESPLRRAGLLQLPRSHASSYNSKQTITPHSQDDIRLNTVQLSNMLMAASPLGGPPAQTREQDSFIFPAAGKPFDEPIQEVSQPAASTSLPSESSLNSADLSTSDSSLTSARTTKASVRSSSKPSGLSLLRALSQEHERSKQPEPSSSPDATTAATAATAHLGRELVREPTPLPVFQEPPRSTILLPSDLKPCSDRPPSLSSLTDLTETAPLLGVSPGHHPSYFETRHILPEPKLKGKRGVVQTVANHVREVISLENIRYILVTSVKSLPAVILGLLLNVLDGVSYGMIIFPTAGVFAGLGPMGVSMFFVSTIVAQLVYTFGGSGFAGANGSMMIEVVPFFRILATSIAEQIGEDKPHEIIATTLVAFTLSSFLTGLSFFILGILKLGVIIGFFPRHILVGCIGGVGAFLIETGFTVSLRMEDDFQINWETFKFVFLNTHSLVLWAIPLSLAIVLRIITHKYHHQLIFPLYFTIIPAIFYLVVVASGLDLGSLRKDGWVFDMGSTGEEAWYKYYSYFDLGAVKWESIWLTLPTQFALLFFNILHPPLNVPALSISLNEDVDTDKELVAHGYSNLLAGAIGVVPNYLVYVNTLLFYRVGGGTRVAGFLLAVTTTILLLIGTWPIAFIPVMVVAALIFVLGIDLVKEAIWDTRHRVTRMEYITILSIMVCMTMWDFVIGVLLGLIVSCFFFVIQNSQRRSIRAFHTGDTAISTVRRPSSQRAYIREVSKQTTILRLQGFLFFGTIASVEHTIKNVIEGPSWCCNPVRFLVLDLSLVAGVDMSSAEAFVRVHRLLAAKYVTLVFCGFSADSAIAQALQSVGVLGGEKVELFLTFDEAMEWTENAYLRAWFRSQKPEVGHVFALPGRQDADINFQSSLVGSPRRSHLDDAGKRTMAHETLPHLIHGDNEEPHNTLVKAFSSFGGVTSQQFQTLAPYLERVCAPEGLVLWKQNDPSDGLYIIESGILRAIYKFSDHTPSIEESMVPGTLAGELSALSDLARNATVVVERPAVLWRLTIENLRRLEADDPSLAMTFMQLVLKAAKIDNDTLLSALATRQ